MEFGCDETGEQAPKEKNMDMRVTAERPFFIGAERKKDMW
jgi:hypothetical protein